MLGLGSTLTKVGKIGLPIVTDNLVLQHKYIGGEVRQVSTGAASFTASNTDYITMGDACDLGTVDFSICFWAYVPEGTSQNFISKFTSSNDRWFLNTDGSDKIQFQARVSSSTIMSQAYSGDAVPENEWFHVAVTCDRSDGSSGLKIYLNGIVGTASAASATNMDNAANLHFGRQDTTYMGGYIANVGIWSGTALTQAEIKSIMWKNYAGLTSDETASLSSWWNLDSTISEDYANTSEGDDDPSSILDLTLDNHDTTFTEASVANSDFTSGSGTTITSWGNEDNQWTRVNDTTVSGTTSKLLQQNVLTDNIAHKIVIRAKRTTTDSAAELAVYIGSNNWCSHALTNDFAEYTFHGLQADDTTLFLYNRSNTNVTVDWVKVYRYDGNVGILLPSP